MESRLIICVVILALVVDGGKAQLDVCGNVTVNPRIVGGSEALTGSWPWMASLYYRGDLLICGGTLINDMWILTAASCLITVSSSSITVSLGRLNQQAPNPNAVSRSVAQIINHPSFNRNTFDNDIALLRLSSSAPLNDYIRPVCLAADGSVFRPGSTGWITGWGSRSTSGSTADRMQQAEVPVVSNKKCKDTYGKSMITDNMMCAGGGGKGVCAGDGGGPMVVKQGNQWIQGGVMSFVYRYGCAQTNKPDGYARVSRYASWIKRQITSNQPGFVYNSSNVISGKSNVFSLLLLSILPLVFAL